MAAFSAGSPKASKPIGWSAPKFVAAPEMRDNVADRVDEHVAHVQVARRVGQHLQDVGLLTVFLR